MGLFLHYGCKPSKAFLYLGIFAVMTPLGSLAGLLIESSIVASLDIFFTYSMAVVIGIFLHVSTSILFETEDTISTIFRNFSPFVWDCLLLSEFLYLPINIISSPFYKS